MYVIVFVFTCMNMFLCVDQFGTHRWSAFYPGMSVVEAGVAAGFAGSVLSRTSPKPPSVQSECDFVL